MSAIISVFVDDETERRLIAISFETGRSIADLAESAISEAALDAYRKQPTESQQP